MTELNRQQRRKKMKGLSKEQQSLLKEQGKSITKLEFYAYTQYLEQVMGVMDAFLYDKFGEEYKDFALKSKKELDENDNISND